jgi:hypothetical protein
MASGFRTSLRVIGQGLSLSFWRRPRSRVELTGLGTFLIAVVLATTAFVIQDYFDVGKPATFDLEGWQMQAAYYLILLIATWLASHVLKRPALWLVFAALATVIGIFWTALSIELPLWFDQASDIQLDAWQALLAMAGFMVVWQTLRFLAAECSAPRRLFAALLFVAVMAWPWYARQDAWPWYPADQDSQTPESPPDNGPETNDSQRAEATPSFDSETVMADQPALLQREFAALRPQTPGKTDLFAIGFAGDGSESVFRNEVDYFSLLMSRRFGAEGHTLSLINHPDTLEEDPLATLSNLETALKAVGNRMDRREDVLLLFLTSHGSRDHQLYVGMDPLPLDQITPQNLRAALDASGIQNRVVVVSACYSGGFVDALRDAHTLVITAARADRSSFGCGADSDITFFGKAFLTEGLNQTTDFEQAFAIASKRIREWELAQDETPSVPQIAVGAAIDEKLRQLQATLPPSGPVAFMPAKAGMPQASAPRAPSE